MGRKNPFQISSSSSLGMRLLPLLRSCVHIASFLSAAHAFNVTVGTPTQCDDLVVSWTGTYIPCTCNVFFLNFTLIVRWTGII